MQYRKKPVVIEAVRFIPHTTEDHPAWWIKACADGAIYFQGGAEPYATIETTEGVMRADPGDWIIKGVKGELYSCKQDIFAATYTRDTSNPEGIALVHKLIDGWNRQIRNAIPPDEREALIHLAHRGADNPPREPVE